MTSESLLQPLDLTFIGTNASQAIVWEGLQEILIILINLYYIHKYDTCDGFDEDLKHEGKRLRRLGHISPYECRFYRIKKFPEIAIHWSITIRQFIMLYTLLKGGYRVTGVLSSVISWFNQSIISVLSIFFGI